MNKRIPGIAVWLVAASTFSLLATILFWWSPAHAVETGAMAAGAAGPDAMNWGFVAAALATGSAAIGAIAEKPELLGRSLIFVGLAEGIAIYGLIISILILNRVM